MLTCQHLSATYRGGTLFRDVGFSMLPASLLSITGSNETGRRALLRMIAGLDSVPKGRILFAGEDTQGHSDDM